MVEVGEHDVGQRELQQVDLFLEDERQQQVERPAEDVQVELERGEAHGCTVAAAPDDLAAAGGADAHPLAHVRERAGGDRARPLGAGGEHRLELGLVGAQRRVALAHGREVLDHGLGDGALKSP